MRKTGSFELYAISAVRDTLVLLCALSELCVEDPIPIPEVFNTEDAEFTEPKRRSVNYKGTETQRPIHGEDLFGQVLLCAIVSLW